MRHLSLSKLLFLVSLVFAVYFTGLGSARLWDRDEPRNSRASHEMLQRGDWIVPTFNGQLRDHKPILLYWGQMASYVTLGESEFTARLPSAICALLSLVGIAVLASRLSGYPRGINVQGYWAAGVLGTCLLFVMAGRAATPDACLIAFSTLGISALVCSVLSPALPFSSGNVGRARWIPAMFGYTMLGLAVLAKGPVGLVLPLAVVHIWWLVCDRHQTVQGSSQQTASTRPTGLSRLVSLISETWAVFHPLRCLRALLALKTIPGILLTLLAAVPWYVAVGLETDGAFLRGFFLEHNLGRAVHSMEGHGGSFVFYPIAFLVGTFPWSLWLIPIGMWAVRSCESSVLDRQAISLGMIWVAVYVGAFSLASTKLPSYITPCYAGAALIVAGFLKDFSLKWWLPSWNWRRAAYAFTAAVGCLTIVSIMYLSAAEQMPLLVYAVASGAVIVCMALAAYLLDLRGRQEWVPQAWLTGAAVFQVVLFGVGATLVDSYRDDLAMMQEVKSVQRIAEGDSTHSAWLSIGGMEPSWVHYLDQEILEITASADPQEPSRRVQEFVRQHPKGLVIVAGEENNQTFGKLLKQELNLVEVAAADRFLKSGRIIVYGSADTQHKMASQTKLNSQATNELRR
ncbi:MAG: glycosyltransferase family 39 protein [bacterium]|nr:glycosyltransferase family 39 protein [bacterium]